MLLIEAFICINCSDRGQNRDHSVDLWTHESTCNRCGYVRDIP